MTLYLEVDDGWFSHPEALATFLAKVRAMERPPRSLTIAAATPPPAPPVRPREPGDDDDDLAELGAGMEEPAPAAVTAPTPPWTPPLATQASRRPPPTPQYDGQPRTPQAFYRWCCDKDLVKRAAAMAKAHGWAKMITHWELDQIAAAYAELTASPPGAYANGRTH